MLTQPQNARFLRVFRPKPVLVLVLGLFLLAACDSDRRGERRGGGGGGNLEMAAPERVGVDSERLRRLSDLMRRHVDAGEVAGAVTMAARHGKIFHAEAVGYRDIQARDPMETTDIFRIYSMTKPITGVAMMILYEEGKFRLSDPVAKYIPEFAGLEVAVGEDRNGNIITEPMERPMTIRQLMSHTAGLTYGLFSQSKVDSMYLEAGVLDYNANLQQMIDRLAGIPLWGQPGSQWHYSVAVDVQGYLVEKLSGQKFGDFLEERIFGPLRMVDTDWYVTAEKASRFAQVYTYNANGDLVADEVFPGVNFFGNPTFQSGGGGLVSTAMDYMRFMQMLLNGGELDGARILSPLTVRMMHRNQLPQGMDFAWGGVPGISFGLDFAIVEDPVEAESYSKGIYYWGGAAGTWFWIDPAEDLVFVGMIQLFDGAGHTRPDLRSASRRAVYQSVVQPNRRRGR